MYPSLPPNLQIDDLSQIGAGVESPWVFSTLFFKNNYNCILCCKLSKINYSLYSTWHCQVKNASNLTFIHRWFLCELWIYSMEIVIIYCGTLNDYLKKLQNIYLINNWISDKLNFSHMNFCILFVASRSLGTQHSNNNY